MSRFPAVSAASFLLLCAALLTTLGGSKASQVRAAGQTFLGFDSNQYPGDAALLALRNTFSFAGYWLSPPPGETTNSWSGKRAALKSHGFGFLLLYRGRTSGQLPYAKDAIEAGHADAISAASTARVEGFPLGSVIFLDIEEGGRFFDTYHAYLRAWAVSLAGEHFLPGFYCSGIVVDEGEGSTIISSDDIHRQLGSMDAVFWVFNDACPPSPGCSNPRNPPPPSASGVPYAAVWQFVRSPREKKIARHCSGYAKDGNCYAPADLAHRWSLDMNVATSANPSAPQE